MATKRSASDPALQTMQGEIRDLQPESNRIPEILERHFGLE